MKKLILAICLVLTSLAIPAKAQTPSHSVVLNWTDTINPASTTYDVYRASSTCSPTASFSTKLNATPVTVKTYTDTTVSAGVYCYVVVANNNGASSPASQQAMAYIPNAAVTNLNATPQ